MNMQQMQELKKLRELVAELVKRVEILENQVQSHPTAASFEQETTC